MVSIFYHYLLLKKFFHLLKLLQIQCEILHEIQLLSLIYHLSKVYFIILDFIIIKDTN